MQRSILRTLVLVGGVGPCLAACGANAPAGSGVDAAVGPDAPLGMDAMEIDAAETDAPIDASPTPRCDPDKPFATPVLIPGINGTGRDVQAFPIDELTMYWSTDRDGTTDLYVATRSSPTGTFGNAMPLAGFATNGTEISSVLTADRLTMYYAYAPPGSSLHEVYFATRTSPSGTWSTGAPVGPLNDGSTDEGDPTISGDGALVYFVTNRNAAATGYDLYLGTRSNGTFSGVGPATELNSNAYDAHPRLTADGLRVYFSSMRTTGDALGGADVWTATRTSTSTPFGTPTRVAELNTAHNESPTWISDDDCVIYLQSDRPGGVGGQDLWQAVKPL